MSSEDSISGVLKLIFFLLIFAGGIASDIIKKNKAKKKAEEEYDEDDEEAKPSVATNTPSPQPYKPPAPAPKKPAPKPAAKPTAVRRADDSEWLATLADQKRREAAKALAKLDTFDRDAHTDGAREPSPAASFTLSAQQAKEGFVLSEILGPPVSMR